MAELNGEGNKYESEIRISLDAIEAAIVNWETICDSSQERIRDILSLADLHTTCSKVNVDNLPVEFPGDVGEMLLFKINCALSKELLSLKEKSLEALQNVLSRVTLEVEKVRKKCSSIGTAELESAEFTIRPNPIVVLRYINEVKNCLTDDYMCRNITLIQFDPKSQQMFKDNWKEWYADKSSLKDLRLLMKFY